MLQQWVARMLMLKLFCVADKCISMQQNKFKEVFMLVCEVAVKLCSRTEN